VAASAAAEGQRALAGIEAWLAAVEKAPEAAARLGGDLLDRARRLLANRAALADRVRTAPVLEFSATKTRIHGDYHLGQVLWAEGDFYIIDFEGEPARPLAQRRQKQSPLKDVAGMLRSLSYASHAALFAHLASRPADRARIEPWARVWQTWASAAFARAYLDVAGGEQFMPAEPANRDALLEFYTLDKVLYELNYELNNRPEWIRIPLWGIADLMS
jgi:maltose alpha-D-glucosyltransferase/alpha-amylase